MELALELFNVSRAEVTDNEPARQALCVEAFRATLEWLNKIQRERLDKNIAAGVDNVFKGMIDHLQSLAYFRSAEEGVDKMPSA
jgi:hypothetical protein